ncbi:SDR family oxidoreductase [Streptomyces nogalater]
MTVLVTGATGNVGRHVVTGLLAAGRRVRALTRTPDRSGLPGGAEITGGDLTRPETYERMLDGVEAVYLFPVPETAAAFAGAARRAGVRRIVVLSSDSVTDGTDTGGHRRVELAVEDTGLEWTHVRPGEFALNKVTLWAPSIRAEGVVRSAYPDARVAPVHEADVAAVAVTALLKEGTPAAPTA